MNLLQNHSGPSGDLEIISLVWAHYPHYALFLNDFTTTSENRLKISALDVRSMTHLLFDSVLTLFFQLQYKRYAGA